MVLPGGIVRCRALGVPLLCCTFRHGGPRQRGSMRRGQILARHCRGLQTGEQWGGKTVTSNWCPGQSFHADAVLWVRKLLVSQEHRRQI